MKQLLILLLCGTALSSQAQTMLVERGETAILIAAPISFGANSSFGIGANAGFVSAGFSAILKYGYNKDKESNRDISHNSIGASFEYTHRATEKFGIGLNLGLAHLGGFKFNGATVDETFGSSASMGGASFSIGPQIQGRIKGDNAVVVPQLGVGYSKSSVSFKRNGGQPTTESEGGAYIAAGFSLKANKFICNLNLSTGGGGGLVGGLGIGLLL